MAVLVIERCPSHPWIARVSCPLLARAYPQAWRSMCGCALISRPAAAAARSINRAKPAVVKGEPRSLTKTKGDVSLSLEAPQRPKLVALDRVGARRAVLDPADV
jgi:hypothetical protein